MASTDQRTGFRLSWGATPTPAVPTDAETVDAAAVVPVADEPVAVDVPATDEAPAAVDASVNEPSPAGRPSPAPSLPAELPGRAPSRFMADLVRAMRTAADESRASTLESVRAEARTFIEGVQTRSGDEAADLRRAADDDIAGIREWSKAEIARIRAETEERIAARKAALDGALGDHAALLELEIEGIDEAVSTFEADMERFFDRLARVEEPAAFAAVAAGAPEPPSLEAVGSAARENARARLASHGAHGDVATEPSWPAADAAAPPESVSADDTPAADAATGADTTDTDAPEVAPAEDDPRLAALALAAAESEAAVDAASEDDAAPLEEVGAEALAARLAGLVADAGADPAPVATPTSAARDVDATSATRVVVVGLVNVASIASFKRHVARVPGVASVGVSSGPDGEFVFTATHTADVSLRDVIPTLPGFGARVTGASDGVLTVSARDPE